MRSSLFGQANGSSLRNNRVIPQLLTSVPALNDAASYLSETTSLFTRCFMDYSGELHEPFHVFPFFALTEPASRGLGGQEMVTFGSAESRGSPALNTASSSGSDLAVCKASQSSVDAPLLHEGLSRTLSRKSSQSGNAATNSEDLSEGSSAQVLSRNTSPNGISIFQGLIERVRRTVRGSADDIGWLQRASHMPPVDDQTDRFVEIIDDIRHGLHGLPNSMVYLLVPGLFSNHGPLYFVNTKTSFSKMGLTCHIAKIHSEACVEKNAREIKDYIEEIYWGSRKRVLLLGHSKGGVDAAAALSMYWTDLKDKVGGLVLAQSPYGGSPIASDILREGQLGDYVNIRKLMETLICKVIKIYILDVPETHLSLDLDVLSMTVDFLVLIGDLLALEDLTYERRKEFLSKYPLPRELPVVSFRTEASISPAVLATLSRVAHAELPTFSTAQPATTFPVVMPLGAVMAACAQLLQIRYGEKSDGLVTCCDAEVPGSVVVRPKRKLDHAWMVYSELNDNPTEADASQVCEALLTLLVEVGQRRRHELSNKDE
uniref:Triacylglycerol lipase n=1 Tax=Solanum tuberosum TaxID=4113 RepID=M1CG96_SOLTU